MKKKQTNKKTCSTTRLSQRVYKACFKRRATAVPNSIDRIKFDFSTAVAQRLKPSRATAMPNSIHENTLEYI